MAIQGPILRSRLDHQQSWTTGSSNTAIRNEISNFDNLRENLTQKLKLGNWFHLTSHQSLHIFNVDEKANGNLSIRNTIRVDIELVLKVYGTDDETLFTVKLVQWPQLQSLIEQFGLNVKREDESFNMSVIDETVLRNDDVKDDWDDVHRKSEAFEFCATNNAETDLVDIHRPVAKLEEVSTVKMKPTTSDSQRVYDCSACGSTFDRYPKLLLHNRLHETYFCSICNETYSGKMSRHMRKRHPAERESYECHICHRNYAKLNGLRRHMHTKHVITNKKPAAKGINLPMVKCNLCDKSFSHKYSLKAHKYRSHDKRNWKECQICNRSYDNVKRHMRTVHGDGANIKNSICDICGAAYKESSMLKKHMETKHSDDGEFFCHICNNGKNYRKHWYLKKHFANVHAYVEQSGREYSNAFECNLCNERFPSSNTLRKHIGVKHNGVEGKEMQFKCDICNKKFANKHSMYNHKASHTEKMYVCPECGQPFSHPSHLKSHLSRHKEPKHQKGKKKKKCTMCDKQYVAITDLRVHMVKIHAATLPIEITEN